MALLALQDHGALHAQAEILGVGAGNEPTSFWLSNIVRRVFATDLYGGTDWRESASETMLIDPGRHWPGPLAGAAVGGSTHGCSPPAP